MLSLLDNFKQNKNKNISLAINSFKSNKPKFVELLYIILQFLTLLFLIIGIIVFQYLTIYGESNILTMIFSNDPVSLREQIYNNNDNKNIIKTSIVINYLLIICLIGYIFINIKLNNYLIIFILLTFIFYLVGLSFITEFIFNNNNDIITDVHKRNFMKFTVILMNYKNILINILISIYIINKK
jgi:hypothetical protein